MRMMQAKFEHEKNMLAEVVEPTLPVISYSFVDVVGKVTTACNVSRFMQPYKPLVDAYLGDPTMGKDEPSLVSVVASEAGGSPEQSTSITRSTGYVLNSKPRFQSLIAV